VNDRHVTLVVWVALGMAVVVTQLAGSISGGRFPGLGVLVGRAASHRVGRLGLLLAWMWLGWHAFAR
jgi:Family of unknown function (DUF6186)